MATEQQASRFCLASVLEDFLKQSNVRPSIGVDSSSRKVDEASLRRYEAAMWLRRTIGVVGGKDLPAEPSEEEFRIGLRSGILLCNVLNKVQPGAVPKVVEAPNDSLVNQDGAALSAFQYFENLRNFLVAVEEIGLPTFEVSDFEKGGKSTRIVECVLALKSYCEWKHSGGSGSWRYIVNLKPTTFGMAKQIKRKPSESLMNPSTSDPSDIMSSEQSACCQSDCDSKQRETSHSIDAIVRMVLSDKKQEEVLAIVESMLNKVMVEFECRLATQSELHQMSSENKITLDSGDLGRPLSGYEEGLCDSLDGEEDVTNIANNNTEASSDNNVQNWHGNGISRDHIVKQQMIVERQQIYIEELKHALKSTKAGVKFLQIKYFEEFNNLGKHLHGLAHAATGYQKVLEENRKLYNQVQDLKGNIRVYCRVRPLLPEQTSVLTTVDHIEDSTISIATPATYGKNGRKSFTFNKVFSPSATQGDVFADTQPLIRSVLDGYNVCIFAYGQTGSGKTYTMTGPKVLTEESLGVNYRALTDLFLLSNQRKDTFSYNISVQMLEIYNEQVRDLLTTDGQNKRLEIRNSSPDGINVPDATIVPVSSTSDVIYLMNLGLKNRAVSSTAMNDRSSRSHSCLTVHVQGKDLTSGTILRGSMHLVDLAGSERVDKSEVTGDRLKEAQHINKSLSALGDVIASLAQKNNHVPYRNSKLTQLLQDSLGGQAKTLMFVHISPELEALAETISTLKFAERVATVELGAARVNKDISEIKELKEQISSLKAALARKESEAGHTQLPRPISTDKLIRRKSLGFISPLPKSPTIREFSSKRKVQIDDLNSIEGQSDSTSSRRQSLETQELTSSPSWVSLSLDGKDDDREYILGEWIDKHENGIIRKPENRKTYNHNGRKEDQGYEVRKIRYEDSVATDESETSDCSESSLMWQLNVQVNVPRVPNGSNPSLLASSSKPMEKPQTRIGRAAETRSMIPSLIPAPTRRLSLGTMTSPAQPQTSSRQNTVMKKRQGHQPK
ncbi:PREDICTED: kinesin-like protein KIN-14G [Tarenaya hassleriana]|uniref:kinesin-like protein KIN-14G n=1 Tax=Tarenaya hassleriana TaxID=28532 RepID=UPI00053C70F0|nr:PREDICTED: kinesin-like protein KIN-14G [Tarenaya hassleriana]